jgi:hypothetical protein
MRTKRYDCNLGLTVETTENAEISQLADWDSFLPPSNANTGQAASIHRTIIKVISMSSMDRIHVSLALGERTGFGFSLSVFFLVPTMPMIMLMLMMMTMPMTTN